MYRWYGLRSVDVYYYGEPMTEIFILGSSLVGRHGAGEAIYVVPTVVETTVRTVVKTTEVRTVVYTFPELDLE
jgi:hypothetical protein